MAWTVRDGAGRRRRGRRGAGASLQARGRQPAGPAHGRGRSGAWASAPSGAFARWSPSGRRPACSATRCSTRATIPSYGAKGVYLQDLYVVPEARGRGIGRALMAAVARACQADGGCYLFWNALERNHAGRAFYRRIGAREEPVVTLSLQPDALRRLAREGLIWSGVRRRGAGRRPGGAARPGRRGRHGARCSRRAAPPARRRRPAAWPVAIAIGMTR